MKRAFVYVMLATMLFNGSNLLVSNVQAAENSVISFLSNENGNFDIFLIDTQGTVLNRLATDAMRKSALTWAPNGYLFAYTSNENGNLDIFKMDIRNKNAYPVDTAPPREIYALLGHLMENGSPLSLIGREREIFTEWM